MTYAKSLTQGCCRCCLRGKSWTCEYLGGRGLEDLGRAVAVLAGVARVHRIPHHGQLNCLRYLARILDLDMDKVEATNEASLAPTGQVVAAWGKGEMIPLAFYASNTWEEGYHN